eukprot:TRINITY_DN66145_c6_g4_i1.p1 TRINITY_DN66145_c6_g4~~TRINITY_DN66145_c6_g4_i1.p1  ORF type:complete len:335 (-),score=22.14 TRINITY_DN66145_c6_g4_i1:266-1270(-)
METLAALVPAIQAAEARIRPHIRETPLQKSLFYSTLLDCNLYFKCENLQHTGSFKARGSLNKVLSLSPDELSRGIVTASSGNHGAGVARALQVVRGRSPISTSSSPVKGIVFVPQQTKKSKLEAIQTRGAEVRFHGNDSAVAETHARAFAEQHNMTFISPYNDLQIMAGQGTIGIEIARQMLPAKVDCVLVAVGGGGLIGGIGTFLKRVVNAQTEIIGCQPVNSEVMKRSIEAGKILDIESEDTLSDGTAGGIEQGSITFPVCQQVVDRYISVTEEEIAQSWRQFIDTEHMLIEGSAAVPIAALLKEKHTFVGKNVVVLLCGANASVDVLKAAL